MNGERWYEPTPHEARDLKRCVQATILWCLFCWHQFVVWASS